MTSKFRPFVLVVTYLVLVSLFGYSLFFTARYYWSEFSDSPDPIRRYLGVNLGDSYKEVRYQFGDPFFVSNSVAKGFRSCSEARDEAGECHAEETDAIKPAQIPGNKSLSDYDRWWYFDRLSLPTIWVRFDDRKAAGIKCTTNYLANGKEIRCPDIYGLNVGSLEEDVLEVLGEPKSEIIEGIKVKWMTYPQYNVEFVVISGEVSYLTVFDAPLDKWVKTRTPRIFPAESASVWSPGDQNLLRMESKWP